jgi:thiol-disulfide isomerase/thioredoxin
MRPLEKPVPRRRLSSVLAFAWILAAPLSLAAGPTHEKGPKPIVISYGKEVALADYLVTGKTTVFDFYSENCPTCRGLAPGVEKLHATRDDIAVVLVNIDRPGAKGIDWDSPVSLQYNLPSTPQFKVYGPDGKLKAEGKAAYGMVTGWLK